MLSRAGKLNLLLKELDWLNIGTFEQRKILQKSVFILKQMGLTFEYPYNWYLHGPYSPSLADDAYEITYNEEKYNTESSKYHFKEQTKEKVDKFKDIFKGREKDEDWLELVSSLLFLRKSYGVTGEQLKSLLIDRKKHFGKQPDLVNEAMEFVDRHFPTNLTL